MEGDFVQVVAPGSEFIGENGLVTTLWDDQTASFFSPRLKKELKVPVNQLSSCKSIDVVAGGAKKSALLDELNRYDLVDLVGGGSGVIVKFNN